MVKSTTGRRGKGHTGDVNRDQNERAPWEQDGQDDTTRDDLQDIYDTPEDPGAGDYDWAAGDDEEED